MDVYFGMKNDAKFSLYLCADFEDILLCISFVDNLLLILGQLIFVNEEFWGQFAFKLTGLWPTSG